MEIIIREILPADFERSAQIIRKSFEKQAEQLSLSASAYPAFPAFIETSRLIFQSSNGVKMLGAFADGEQTGFIGLDIREAEIILDCPCVIPDMRHQGQGSMLVAAAKEKAEQLGYRRISTVIPADDGHLKEWFEKKGFSPKEIRRLPFYPMETLRMEFGFSEEQP